MRMHGGQGMDPLVGGGPRVGAAEVADLLEGVAASLA
jgi:hypothetical protein